MNIQQGCKITQWRNYVITQTAVYLNCSKSAADNEIERGRYVVAISGCNDCHTHRFLLSGGKTPEKEWLTGSTMGWRGPWGTSADSWRRACRAGACVLPFAAHQLRRVAD